ncbi:hypothetical protein [Kineococcus arenarius]|uniref:hypothetical protein n=1 Tax=unclassified Kineococcus TaxID=2621656 RepID=UPI003D7D155C
MLQLSWAGLRDRWTSFAGAVLTVCLGVALVQSSLLLLLASATGDAPPGPGRWRRCDSRRPESSR